MLLDDFLEHLNRFVPLVRQNKASRQFLSRVCVVRLQFESAQVKRDRFLQLLGCCVIICYFLEDRGIVSGVVGCFFENLIGLFQFIRFRLGVRLEKNGHVEFSEPHPKSGIVTANFCGAIQNFERLFLLAGCNFDFHQALVTFHVFRIQGDRAVGIIDGLIRLLEILEIDESKLLIRLGIIRVCLNRVFEHVNCLRKIVLLY